MLMFLLLNRLNYLVFCWLDENEYFFAATVVGLGPSVVNSVYFFLPVFGDFLAGLA